MSLETTVFLITIKIINEDLYTHLRKNTKPIPPVSHVCRELECTAVKNCFCLTIVTYYLNAVTDLLNFNHVLYQSLRSKLIYLTKNLLSYRPKLTKSKTREGLTRKLQTPMREHSGNN